MHGRVDHDKARSNAIDGKGVTAGFVTPKKSWCLAPAFEMGKARHSLKERLFGLGQITKEISGEDVKNHFSLLLCLHPPYAKFIS
jgi:hypothetical protein